MAVDTPARRLTATHAGRAGPLIPDGTIAVADRGSLGGVYVFTAIVVVSGSTATYRSKNTARYRS